MIRLTLVILMVGTLASWGAAKPRVKPDLSKLPPAAKTAGVTYSGQIRTIFDTSCVKCHGPEKSKGHLRLDSLEGALKGGESGKAIVPGNSAESPLLHSISYVGDEDYFMPPPGNKAGIARLQAEQVSLIRAWVDQGAK